MPDSHLFLRGLGLCLGLLWSYFASVHSFLMSALLLSWRWPPSKVCWLQTVFIVVAERSASLDSLASVRATCLEEWNGSESGAGEGWAVGSRVGQRLVLWVWELQFLVCMVLCLVWSKHWATPTSTVLPGGTVPGISHWLGVCVYVTGLVYRDQMLLLLVALLWVSLVLSSSQGTPSGHGLSHWTVFVL